MNKEQGPEGENGRSRPPESPAMPIIPEGTRRRTREAAIREGGRKGHARGGDPTMAAGCAGAPAGGVTGSRPSPPTPAMPLRQSPAGRGGW